MFQRGVFSLFLVFSIPSVLANVNGAKAPMKLPNIFGKSFHWSIPTIASTSEKITPSCLQDSAYYAQSLAGLQPWALRMFDATGKMPDGIMSGNIHSMGHFDQCIGIQTDRFSGQYCSVFFKPTKLDENQTLPDNSSIFPEFVLATNEETEPANLTSFYAPYTPSVALCVPSTCAATDVELIIKELLGGTTFYGYELAFATSDLYCRTADKKHAVDTGTIVMLTILSTIALLFVLGTVYDIWFAYASPDQSASSRWGETILCFSVYKNGSRILNVDESNVSLRCLHGMRFLSMTWVVMGHSWAQNSQEFAANWPTLLQAGHRWTMQAITNGLVSVDTFFFLSGLLVAYTTLKELDKTGKFNVLLFYVHRYLRLTPVYAVILGFIANVSVHLGNGPMWSTIELQTQECRRTWWTNLLYVNNIAGPGYATNICMAETWYLACDFQLLLFAPLLIYPLWKSPRMGGILLCVLGVLSIVGSMIQTGIEHLPPTIISTRMDISEATVRYEIDYYTKVLGRFAPYVVGISMGWVFYASRNKDIHMSKGVVTLGWCVSTGTALAVLYGLYGYADGKQSPDISQITSISYSGLHKLAWAMSLSWLAWACIHGYGGFVNTFLSWKAFIPLSRLTYCTYLIHLNWMTLFYARSRVPMYYTTVDQVFNYMGHLTISMGFAFVACVCVEAPFLNLEKILFTGRR